MQEKGRAGIARVVMARSERMVLLEPLGKGLLATVLRYPWLQPGPWQGASCV
ncbi:hypothetical protein [Microvirga sp. G4-2]|uniref:hypothetical protein n=1 Tax=Microvirga sp. G4-2 TaxID=3434467 RepID=UPI00404450F5